MLEVSRLQKDLFTVMDTKNNRDGLALDQIAFTIRY